MFTRHAAACVHAPLLCLRVCTTCVRTTGDATRPAEVNAGGQRVVWWLPARRSCHHARSAGNYGQWLIAAVVQGPNAGHDAKGRP